MIEAGVFADFSDAEIADMLGGLGREPDDDVFASAIWSCLVEPGDAVGGVLRGVFGPAAALAVLAEDDAEVLRRLVARGVADAGRIDLASARRRWASRSSLIAVRTSLRCARVFGVRLAVPGDAAWPVGFDDLGLHGPAALWVRGDESHLAAGPSIAIVGSRAATGYGEQVAADLADGLVSRGFGVHSGGAYGIDGRAHRSVLAADGSTVAIMAGGVDRFYPTGHDELLRAVVTSGAVVSEVSCGTAPSKWRFLQRNRLLAATTAATVVVEAGHRSGALNTAGHARQLDRPVGAVPGPITSPASAGCHRLFREFDTACITGPDDIVELVRPTLVADGVRYGPARDSPDEMRLLDALTQRRPRHEAELAARSGLAERDVRSTLAVLEITGRAEERDGGWIRCQG